MIKLRQDEWFTTPMPAIRIIEGSVATAPIDMHPQTTEIPTWMGAPMLPPVGRTVYQRRTFTPKPWMGAFAGLLTAATVAAAHLVGAL